MRVPRGYLTDPVMGRLNDGCDTELLVFPFTRAAVDTIRRIDEKTKKKKAYKDIFSAEAVGLRQR